MKDLADRPEAPSAIHTDLRAIFVSMELSRSSWLITSVSPGTERRCGSMPLRPAISLATLVLAYGLERNFGWAGAKMVQSLPLASAIGSVGLSGAAWAVLTFFCEGTEIEPASAVNKKLVTRGPFRVTRNPMYLGLFLMTLGIAFYRGTLSFFLVPVCIVLICGLILIPFEEAKMRRQYGDQYAEYCAKVRRWI